MSWLTHCALILAGFVGMEIVSYAVHRFVFHGPFWKIHATHHRPHSGVLEHNDVFSLFFAVVAIVCVVFGVRNPMLAFLVPIGGGITLYGLLYFLLHDIYTHRRFLSLRGGTRWMRAIRRAHQRHHQSVDRVGNEPYGLFLFPYRRFWRQAGVRRTREIVRTEEEENASR